MYLEICLLILSVAFLLLVIYCIPIFKQIWRTSKDVAITLDTLNKSLPAILKNLEEITGSINNSTAAVNREVKNFTGTVGRFQLVLSDVVDDIQRIAPLAMKWPVFKTMKNIFAVAKGIHAFLNVLLAEEDKLR